MEIKTGTPNQVNFSHNWESKYGTRYDWTVIFSNGDAGSYTSQSPDPQQIKFKPGVETQYTIEPKKNGKGMKVKHYSPKPNTGTMPQSNQEYQQQKKSDQKSIQKKTALRAAITTFKHADFGKKEQAQLFKVAAIYMKLYDQFPNESSIGLSGILKDAAECVGIHSLSEPPLFGFDKAKDPIELANEVLKYAIHFVNKTK